MKSRIVLLFLLASTTVFGAAPAVNDLPSEVPGAALPIVQQHTYKMAGRVRALLFWISRDDVGTGVLRWRAAGDANAYELLIGSDPLRAPLKLNKWGYLAEQVNGGESTVVGVISQDSEDRLSEVKAGAANRKDARPFDMIRGRVTTSQAYARLAVLHAPSSVTYREAPAVLNLAFSDTSTPVKQFNRPSGARPGFLSSLAELVRISVATSARGKPLTAQMIPYVYGDRLFELRLLDATPMAQFERDGRVFQKVIRGRFETGRAGTRPGSRFELIFGSTGPLAEVPILISYQPKWWLQVELMIES